MKKLFKGLLLCICIIFLTSCGRAKFIEKEIPLPKEIKNLSEVLYLGENVYGIDILPVPKKYMRRKNYKLINTKGDLIRNKSIESIESIGENTNLSELESIFIVFHNESMECKVMLIDKNGKELYKKYDMYTYVGKGIYLVSNFDDTYVYINSKGNEICKPFKYRNIYTSTNPDLLPCCNKEGKCGFINSKGKVVIPFIFDRVENHFKHQETIAVFKNKKGGIIDTSGNIIIPIEFDDIEPFQDELTKVCLNKKWGLIDKNKKLIVPCKFDDIYYQGNKVYRVMLDNNSKIGIINNKGDYIIKPLNIENPSFNILFIDDKNITTCKEGKTYYTRNYKLLDKNKKELTKTICGEMRYFEDDLFLIRQNNKYGFINRKGKMVVPVKYDDLSNFNDDFCICELNGKYGVLDKTYKYILNPKYEYIKYISKGYFAVKLNKKWGIVDRNAKIIKPIEYEDISGIQSKIKCDYNVLIKNKNKGLLMKLE